MLYGMDLPRKLYGLDLFSGIGGGALALAPWIRPLAYCECDEYAQGVLLERQCQGEIPVAPIWDDIRTLAAGHIPLPADIIYGGFPCQDISVAGNGAGLEGERSGLFFEVRRLIAEIQPAFVFLENVPAIRTRGGERVGKELASLGYDCRWTTVSAAEVGAPHLRNRWFLLAAHAERLQLWDEQGRGSGTDREGPAFPRHDGAEGTAATDPDGVWELQSDWSISVERGRTGDGGPPSLANSAGNGRDQRGPESVDRRAAKFGCPSGSGVGQADTGGAGLEGREYPYDAWAALRQLGCGSQQAWPSGLPLPALRRGDDGLSNRVDRLKGLGNAWVPQAAREAFMRLSGIKAAI